MGIACKIVLTEPEDGVYRPGQVVKGILKYIVDKPTECKSINLCLVGIGIGTGVERIGRKPVTFHEKEEHVIQQYCIDKEKVLDIGLHKYPFIFALPLMLPKYFSRSVCTIKFKIHVKFERKSFFNFNLKFCKEIPHNSVRRPIIEDPSYFEVNKTLFQLFSTDTPVIKLKGILVKNYISQGEKALIHVEVLNDTDLTALIRSELICCTLSTANNGRIERIQGCASRRQFVLRGLTTMLLTVPTKSELYTINTIDMIKQYRIRIYLLLPLPHRNSHVDVVVKIEKSE